MIQEGSKYLTFEWCAPEPGRKTPSVVVLSRSGGYSLGVIRWFGNWRQFCFYPRYETVFNAACLDDIKAAIGELMQERRK